MHSLPFYPVPVVKSVEVQDDVGDHADEEEAVRHEYKEQRRGSVEAIG